MSVYYFDIADNSVVVFDEVGLGYATRDAARSDAVSALQSVVRDLVLDRDSHREVSIKIRDENGYVFEAKVAFTAEWFDRRCR